MQLQDVRCFLLDMDGTFYLGGQIIPGSLEFIEKVVSSGRDFMFLTNNSSHNANFYVQKLAKMGLSIDRRRVMTSGEATCEKISELHRIWNSKPQALDNQLRFVVRIRFHPLYARHQYDAAGCRPSCKRSSFEPERLDRFIPCCVLRPVEKTLCSREKSCLSIRPTLFGHSHSNVPEQLVKIISEIFRPFDQQRFEKSDIG